MLQARKRASLPMTSSSPVDLPLPITSLSPGRSPSRESLSIEFGRIFYVLKVRGKRHLHMLASHLSALHASILSIRSDQSGKEHHPAAVALSHVYFYITMVITLAFAFCESCAVYLFNWVMSFKSQSEDKIAAHYERISEQLDNVLLKIQVLDAKVAAVFSEQAKHTDVSDFNSYFF
jgi:hypothetical protein